MTMHTNPDLDAMHAKADRLVRSLQDQSRRMNMSSIDTTGLHALGANSKIDPGTFNGPHPHLLEAFPNPFANEALNRANADGEIYIEAPEFTSLCPLTGQPDFATIKISYVPDQLCVESKSIKLYLMSYRNVGEFHEACVVRICSDLVELLNPMYLQVRGEFTPRGGIPFWPAATYVREDVVKAEGN